MKLRNDLDVPVDVLGDRRPLARYDLGRHVRARVEGHFEGRVPERSGQCLEIARQQRGQVIDNCSRKSALEAAMVLSRQDPNLERRLWSIGSQDHEAVRLTNDTLLR